MYSGSDDPSVLVADVHRVHGEYMLWVYPIHTFVEWSGDCDELHAAPPCVLVVSHDVETSVPSR